MAVEASTRKALQNASSPEIGQPVSAPNVWSIVAAVALAAFYLATTLYIASHRLFWSDELFTIHIARLPHWTSIWKVLGRGADSLPPIYYMVVRTFGKPFGYSEIAVRLPSTLAMVAGLLITFDCTRRLTDGVHGLIALSIVTCSFLPYYGYEARSYAISFMLAAVALWVWTNARLNKKWSAILFGSVLFVAVTIHYYAVLLVVPYALYELSRWRPRQSPSQKLIAGVFGVTVPAALLSPLILSFARQFSAGFWGHPSFYLLMKVFSDLFPAGLFLLALMMAWIVLVCGEDRNIDLRAMQPGEAVGWFCLCIPLAGFVAAEKTNAFAAQYFIGALPGVAVAFSCCVWRHFHNTLRVSLGVFLLLASAGVAKQVAVSRTLELADRFGLQSATRGYLGLEDSLRKDSKRFMLFESPYLAGLYLGSEYYSKHPEECILLLSSDAAQEGSWVQGTVLNLAQYYPVRFWRLDDLKTHARDTALIAPTPATLDAMKLAGFTTEVRFSKPLEVVYLK